MMVITKEKHNGDPYEECEVTPNCLECPLPACKYDDPQGFRDWAARKRLTANGQGELFYYPAEAIRAIAQRDGIDMVDLNALIHLKKVNIITRAQLMASNDKRGIQRRQTDRMIHKGYIAKKGPEDMPPIKITALPRASLTRSISDLFFYGRAELIKIAKIIGISTDTLYQRIEERKLDIPIKKTVYSQGRALGLGPRQIKKYIDSGEIASYTAEIWAKEYGDAYEPCDVHGDCLECPLPACKYDDEQGYRDWAREHSSTQALVAA